MRVVVPTLTRPLVAYAPLEDERRLMSWVVARVLTSYGIKPDYRIIAHDEDAYRRVLLNIWQTHETVIIVEHDIIPWPGAIEELLACSCQWGTYSYKTNGGTGVAHMLGCAKLTPGLMDAVPTVWDDPAPWWELDQRLFFAAREKGIEPHLHRPAVTHLNPRELRGSGVAGDQ